jgi:crossover junction endodeoxyribonuclease RuvC
MQNSKTRRIIGIDPGTSLLGYGVIDIKNGNYKAIAYSTIETLPGLTNAQRVKDVYNSVDKLMKKYRPDTLALEKLFFFKNTKTVTAVSEIRGVLLLCAALQGLVIREFTPLQVKQAVSMYGRASKEQVQVMVKTILDLPDIPRPDDVADALAIAICSANTIEY